MLFAAHSHPRPADARVHRMALQFQNVGIDFGRLLKIGRQHYNMVETRRGFRGEFFTFDHFIAENYRAVRIFPEQLDARAARNVERKIGE